MSGPDDTKELVKATAEGVTEGAVRAALEPFVAPIAETGQVITDLIRFQRWKIQHRILEKATAFLKVRGLEPGEVPLRVLVPLLEAASLEDEDDEDMQARWASLLANAAAGALGAEVLPSFVEILASLSPAEAALLDRLSHLLSEEPWKPQLETLFIKSGLSLEEAYANDSPQRIRYVVMLENLARLGLCVVRPPDAALNRVRQQIEDHPAFLEHYTRVEMTNLGRAFVKACYAPTGAEIDTQEQDAAP